MAINGLYASNFKLIDGIPGWGQDILVIKAELFSDLILFHKSPIGDSPTTCLLLDKIISTHTYTENELIEKSKSVIGRAAVGSLFGPAGAIVGAISGTGSKKKHSIRHYYCIEYLSSSDTPALITLGTDCMGCHVSKFDEYLKPYINVKPKQEAPTFL